MTVVRVAVSSSSQIAADAACRVARAGGNAVDAAIAASLVQLVTEPGVVSLGAGAFIVIWRAGESPVMIDAAPEMPGRDLPHDRFGTNLLDVMLPYGGGSPTTVGYGSVATPGALAGYDLAARRFGCTPWRQLVEPALGHVADGFPLSPASKQYIDTTHDGIFGWNPGAMEPLQNDRGQIKQAGELIHIEGLAESLAAIAEHGVDEFYRGKIARLIADDVQAGGGLLTLADLAACRRWRCRWTAGAWRLRRRRASGVLCSLP